MIIRDSLNLLHKSMPFLIQESQAADRQNRFVWENIQWLKDRRLLGLNTPKAFGGSDGTPEDCVRIVAKVAEACLSSAVCLGMHFQQVEVLKSLPFPFASTALAEVAKSQALCASITTDTQKGGSLFHNEVSMEQAGQASSSFDRFSPIVSYPEAARYFLATFGIKKDRHTSSALGLIDRNAAEFIQLDRLDMMGMRGTGSHALRMKGELPSGAVLIDGYESVAKSTLAPFGHLMWAAAWYGAALGCLDRTTSHLRQKNIQGKKLSTEHSTVKKLGQVKTWVDVMDAMLSQAVRIYQDGQHLPLHERNFAFFNSLKVASSCKGREVVWNLINIVGLAEGYFCGRDLNLELVFRDICSSELMFHNDRLLHINGSLALFYKRHEFLNP